MKEVIAIIRMDKINDTKKALQEAGFPSMTCRRVSGRGKKKVDYALIQELIDGKPIGDPNTLESISESHRLISKRMIIVVVKDEEVKKLVDTIIEVNQTGNMGDGKIFVKNIEEVIRVRTDEIGIEAV
ncbi:nitrogen regulatory protein P-II family [Natranaerovirga hydrolytica]|uniref:Nitrogen regulatory protein P-II family n=1 Tax=Natranaerovirga hydrolytica TaxID=680378 RepID=A0A4V2Q097_9FIRM|nr:P-II family nitrogen regulator [Natranaerovirga hydrolytica]TCK92901.1 nitrogen regulatory protein P-II family [Natranaerovirga hydrolytica]